jgi:predicted GNAT superfamily acetyltransferase
MSETITIRPFATLEEYEKCVDFQEEIWGRGFSEKVSAAILMIANRIGGIAAGAFDEDEELHGFVFGLTGVVDGKLVHWSDMLAVSDGGRDRGLGTRLKGYQRDLLLARGVEEMRWTFDPLQGRNAHVNFSKLGIISREYVENMYGNTDSPLHRGVGTDRLVATWRMASERVMDRLAGRSPGLSNEAWRQAPKALGVERDADFPAPAAPHLDLEAPYILVAVPGDIETIMEQEMSLAVGWREATRKVFTHYLGRGYLVQEFLRGADVSHYLLASSETTSAEVSS